MFSECIRGMAEACRFLGLPVTGGNVSFYNESPQGPVLPTPTIGMVGLINDIKNRVSPFIHHIDYKVALIGKFNPSLGGSEFLYEIHKKIAGKIPEVSLEDEKNLINAFLELSENKYIHSAKDLSLGGILIALCKTAFGGKVGLEIDIQKIFKKRWDLTMFGESACSVIISYPEKFSSKISEICKKHKIDFDEIGESKSTYKLNIADIGCFWRLEELEQIFESGLISVFE
jgi:phosphoribosylformylglycinamidine synthase